MSLNTINPRGWQQVVAETRSSSPVNEKFGRLVANKLVCIWLNVCPRLQILSKPHVPSFTTPTTIHAAFKYCLFRYLALP